MNITTPCDLVKELLDNALDAGATVVEITISSNTVDRISLKDNGSGIDMDDFNTLGKRAYTSKLRDFDELLSIGGTTLGFRGEALASANSLANLTITTKRPGDPIAWRIELIPNTGGVKDKRPVSATTGTTVAATKLFENVPPRKQYAVKESKKCLSHIQQLLRAYILARPSIKVSLKIIGDSKPLWMYSPSGRDVEREAILQMFGTNAWTNCIEIYEEVYLDGEDSPTNRRTQERVLWEFSGFISKPRHSFNDIKFGGTYLSINSQPMSSRWHVVKRMVNILKSLQQRDAALSVGERGCGVFLQLNIKCPAGSYDPNISARKDEVLLFAEAKLLDSFAKVCKTAYEKHSQACSTAPGLISANSPSAPSTKHKKEHCAITTKADGASLVTVDEADDQGDVTGANQDFTIAEASARQKVKATMQTTFKVDMSRKKGNVSDEEHLGTGVEVEIPPRTVHIQESKPPGSEGPQEPNRRESIRKYFQPMSKPDFQIIDDSTATTGPVESSPRGCQLSELIASSRRPLQPLSSNALNRIREEAESSPEPPGSNPMLPRMVRNITREAAMPSLQQIANATRHLAAQGSQGTASASRRAGHEHQDVMDDQGISPPTLTPPPSDPRDRYEQLGLRARRQDPPNAVPSPRARTALQMIDGSREHDASFTRGSRQQSSSTDINNVGYGRMAGVVVACNPSSQGRPQRDAQARPQRGKPFPLYTANLFGDGMEMRPLSGPIRADGPVPAHREMAHPSFSLDCLRELPNRLGRTPAVFERYGEHDVRGQSDGKNNIGGNPQALRTSSHSQTSIGKLSRKEGDLQECLTQRKRPRTLSGQVRWTSTQRLPLESIDMNRQTLTLTTVSGKQHQEIQRQMNQFAALESYINHGNLTTSLPPRNLADIHSVQRALEVTVCSWMKRNSLHGIVNFTLLSEAKGQGRAE
ncbi:DNA mismatch repair protein [Pochonia chlamydosporia 170]|uniref:DNA mismatch repair protein n=1 Tax=Pochonia chlamydosporia 170 TaxID=1380566 RepID=A0A179G4R4_METCM|nr:DNA mismatch repair protein [Pochonia chlamydosporia 170]OAQ72836.1 DNA mismatch repair protein [Pochonia chlamydosporia 170]